MRAEIQGNGILPEYCSAIGRDCNATTVARPLYHPNQFVKNGQDHASTQTSKVGFLGYGKGEIRKAILKHETIFRFQVQELHRLYVRQRELMNDMKRCTMFEKRTGSLEVPANVLGTSVENQMQKRFYEFPVFGTNSWSRNHQASCANSAFHDVRRPEREVDSSRPYVHLKNSNHQTDLNLADSIDGKLTSLPCLARADVPVNSGSVFHLASTNFYENPLAGRKGGICFSIMDSRNEMYGTEHLSDGFTDPTA